jgi:hypothetical protein
VSHNEILLLNTNENGNVMLANNNNGLNIYNALNAHSSNVVNNSKGDRQTNTKSIGKYFVNVCNV